MEFLGGRVPFGTIAARATEDEILQGVRSTPGDWNNMIKLKTLALMDVRLTAVVARPAIEDQGSEGCRVHSGKGRLTLEHRAV